MYFFSFWFFIAVINKNYVNFAIGSLMEVSLPLLLFHTVWFQYLLHLALLPLYTCVSCFILFSKSLSVVIWWNFQGFLKSKYCKNCYLNLIFRQGTTRKKIELIELVHNCFSMHLKNSLWWPCPQYHKNLLKKCYQSPEKCKNIEKNIEKLPKNAKYLFF